MSMALDLTDKKLSLAGSEGTEPALCRHKPLVTIHNYKLLVLSNMSMIGSERYAEAMKIARGQQRFRGAFTKKPSME
jgi:hypothetical protein